MRLEQPVWLSGAERSQALMHVFVNMQASLEAMGMDSSLAVARARSRSRVGRKRERSEGPAAMEVDGAPVEGDVIMEPPKKRIHSSKSRFGRSLSSIIEMLVFHSPADP